MAPPLNSSIWIYGASYLFTNEDYIPIDSYADSFYSSHYYLHSQSSRGMVTWFSLSRREPIRTERVRPRVTSSTNELVSAAPGRNGR